MDGGEGCSEYIIHGTNVDISDPPAEAGQQELEGEEGAEQTDGGEVSKKDTTVEEDNVGKTKDGIADGEKEKEEESEETGQQPQEKSEEDTAALDVDSSYAGQAKL